jgi:hypothetical protein
VAVTKDYKSKPRERKVVEFNLDDRKIVFTAPKDSSLVLPLVTGSGNAEIAQVQVMFNWLSEGLSEEDNDHIISRLQDSDDDFDLPLLQEIVEDLIAEVVDRPTKPRRGSSK